MADDKTRPTVTDAKIFRVIPCAGWVVHDYSQPGYRTVRFPDGREVRERVIIINLPEDV